VVQAPITAWIIVTEMTDDHAMVIPLMAASLIAYVGRASPAPRGFIARFRVLSSSPSRTHRCRRPHPPPRAVSGTSPARPGQRAWPTSATSGAQAMPQRATPQPAIKITPAAVPAARLRDLMLFHRGITSPPRPYNHGCAAQLHGFDWRPFKRLNRDFFD
jgi:hypothetical protein